MLVSTVQLDILPWFLAVIEPTYSLPLKFPFTTALSISVFLFTNPATPPTFKKPDGQDLT